jgi:hypothetical protein
MMRSTVLAALLVCNVPKTKTPILAASTASVVVVAVTIGSIGALSLENLQHWERLRQENQDLRTELDIDHSMVGGSAPMKDIFDLVRRVAPTDPIRSFGLAPGLELAGFDRTIQVKEFSQGPVYNANGIAEMGFEVDGVLIKPHGRSNAKAIKNAIRVGKTAVEQDIMSIFRQLGANET